MQAYDRKDKAVVVTVQVCIGQQPPLSVHQSDVPQLEFCAAKSSQAASQY